MYMYMYMCTVTPKSETNIPLNQRPCYTWEIFTLRESFNIHEKILQNVCR